MKVYDKPRNAAIFPELDAPHVSRVIRCAGNGCTRMVVEYGLHVPETYHAGGLPEETIKIAVAAGAVIVETQCDHHGGQPYARYAPVERVA